MVLGVDPGTAKCGLAVVDPADLRVVERAVVPRAGLAAAVAARVARHGATVVALGSGTHAARVRDELAALGTPIALVDEHGTTLAARARYYAAHPPRGWRRLIPRGLLVPPVPIDDWAAVLIAERHLATTSRSEATRGQG